MSSRALSLATVVLLVGFGAIDSVLAQATNLEAGKTPSQLFAQTCNVCHKSPRGLLKSVAPGSLPGFLRQHYTTSSDMAGVLAAYLVSNGATDTRYQAKDTGKKDGRDVGANPAQAPEHQGRRQRSQDTAKPEGEGAAPAGESTRQKRAARPGEDAAKDGARPDGQAAQDGRKGKRLGKRGKPETEETPKADAAEDRKGEARPDSSKAEPESKPVKPADVRQESPKVEPAASEPAATRPDPVPPVTPAPAAAAKPADTPPPAVSKPTEVPPAASAAPVAKPQEAAPPAAAAAAPPSDSSGPPAPPISR
jgi:hypothetical protein